VGSIDLDTLYLLYQHGMQHHPLYNIHHPRYNIHHPRYNIHHLSLLYIIHLSIP
jgi:hypothetical protein